MIPAMTLWNRQDLEDSKRISGCQGLKDREVWYSAKDFSGSETTLHHTTLVNTYYMCQKRPEDRQHQVSTVWATGALSFSTGNQGDAIHI